MVSDILDFIRCAFEKNAKLIWFPGVVRPPDPNTIFPYQAARELLQLLHSARREHEKIEGKELTRRVVEKTEPSLSKIGKVLKKDLVGQPGSTKEPSRGSQRTLHCRTRKEVEMFPKKSEP